MKTMHFFKLLVMRIGVAFACILWSVNVFAQDGPQKLYFCMNDFGPKTQLFLTNSNIENIASFDNRYIDPTKSLKLNVETLTKAIEKQFPDPSATGTAVLDWEGELYNDLRGKLSPESPEYKSALNEYIKAIQLAKKLRPNIKWGYYAVPFTIHQNDESRLSALNKNIYPLLQQCDIFFPSLYLNGFEPEGSDAFVMFNVKQSLIPASELNKPVLPFVWHRIEDGNKEHGLKIISMDDFNKLISTALKVSYNHQKSAGVVWWGADPYFYRFTKDKALLKETNDQNYKEHYDSLTVSYADKISRSIKKTNSRNTNDR
jgi:hypothetical protein